MEDVLKPGDRSVGMLQVQCQGCGEWLPVEHARRVGSNVPSAKWFRLTTRDGSTIVGTTDEDGNEVLESPWCKVSCDFWYCESCKQL